MNDYNFFHLSSLLALDFFRVLWNRCDTEQKVTIIAICITVLVLVVVCGYLRHKHNPTNDLSQKERNSIINYGLLHFTKSENVDSIRRTGLIPSDKKAVYKSERGLVWFMPCGENVQQSIQSGIQTLRARKESDVCLRLYGFDQNDVAKMKKRLDIPYIVHRGAVKKPFDVYVRTDESWILQPKN